MGNNYPGKISSIEYQSVTDNKAETQTVGVMVELITQDIKRLIGHKATVRIEEKGSNYFLSLAIRADLFIN